MLGHIAHNDHALDQVSRLYGPDTLLGKMPFKDDPAATAKQRYDG
ncbi:hypothetical protein BH10ACT9_BH10ACT9_45990 [soil metagenome]